MAPTTRRSRTSAGAAASSATDSKINVKVSKKNIAIKLEQAADSSIPTPLFALPQSSVASSVTVKTESSCCSTSSGRTKKEFCVICQCYINKGKKSDSPRRHILKHHYQKSLFSCSICGHSSQYDKGHVNLHIRRVHKGVGEAVATPRTEYISDLQEWMERCFPKEVARKYISSCMDDLRWKNCDQPIDETLESRSAFEPLPTDPTYSQFHEVKEEPVNPAYEQSLSPPSLSPQPDDSFLQTREALLLMARIQYEQTVEMINSLFPNQQ